MMILFMPLRWQQQNLSYISNSQKTPHTPPSWASYMMSIVRILEKTDSVIMALYCITNVKYCGQTQEDNFSITYSVQESN